MVTTASAVEMNCLIGMLEELFLVRGVIQVGTLLYDPKSWGLERMLRWSREGKASSRGPPTTQDLGQRVAYTGPVHIWVALYVTGTIGMGWEDHDSELCVHRLIIR